MTTVPRDAFADEASYISYLQHIQQSEKAGRQQQVRVQHTKHETQRARHILRRPIPHQPATTPTSLPLTYVVAPRTRQYHAWWDSCRERNQPFIAIEHWQSRKWGCVKVDFDTCNWRLTDAGAQTINTLLRSVMLASGSRKSIAFPVSEPPNLQTICAAYWINHEDCEPLARMLVLIIAHEHTEVDLLQYWCADADAPSATTKAVDYLRSTLADGARPAREIMCDARENGVSDKVLRSARERLGIQPVRTGGIGSDGQWVWALPLGEHMT